MKRNTEGKARLRALIGEPPQGPAGLPVAVVIAALELAGARRLKEGLSHLADPSDRILSDPPGSGEQPAVHACGL